ncbi:MAG TPA: FAD-dependent thymidylate synthase [Bryobacteraceae bacterium]|nr:FAD-dependent thymidylate synthase [Bryobacteraceae bacterium]HPU71876.1 FAD-dependent thymidylate synthase [Bryobacteraceae bacterium]
MPETPKRVLTLAPMPPEKSAYALARYSRSPDSIRQSLEWVRAHDSQKFLEHYYFQYGHASIADLGHAAICFEGISELAATEIEDEPLWDGQAKSSRYQDFSRTGFITPEEFNPAQAAAYRAAAGKLLAAYKNVHAGVVNYLRERLPRPAEMSEQAYERNIAARAFDCARYLLFLGVPTNVGQVVSIRTIEKQIRRLRASEYAELRSLAVELAEACAAKPDCIWDPAAECEPLCPTLARHVEVDSHAVESRRDLKLWAEQNLPPPATEASEPVDLLHPANVPADIVATLLYPVVTRPFRELYEIACGWSAAQRAEVLDLALRSRKRRDELLRAFRGGLYVFDIVMDIGAWRDLHRHRRCQQFRQEFTVRLGFETPQTLIDAGLDGAYKAALEEVSAALGELPEPGSHYLIPFGARSRFLFKMDFAEAEYICKLRTGVKGHFSYRRIAWLMKQQMERLEPELGRLIEATPPWIEDPLKR